MSDKKAEKKPAADAHGGHGDEHAEGEGGKRKLPLPLPILAGIGGGVVLLVVALVYFFFLSGPSTPAHGEKGATEESKAEGGHGEGAKEGEHGKEGAKEGAKESAKEGGATAKEGSAGDSPFMDMDDMVVNLATLPGKRATYLKIRVTVELVHAEKKPEAEAQKPRIIDTLQVYLRELRSDDLQGSVGMVRLKEELFARIAAVLAPVEVRDILFKELLVQ